jgi:phage tail sheath protein FI
MAFQVSPGVNVSEIDLTAVIPTVQTTAGAIVGDFRWGPVEQRVLIDSEDRLVANFQEPNSTTAVSFFTAANFLAYGNQLYVTRVVNSTAANAITAGNSSITLIKSLEDYENNYSSGISNVGDFVAKYPGALGNSLKVSVCPSASGWSSTLTGTYTAVNGNNGVVFSANQASAIVVGDLLALGPDKEERKVASVAEDGLSVVLENNYTGNTVNSGSSLERRWEYYNFFDRAPGTSAYASARSGVTDQLHIAAVDEDGEWSGTAGQVIERWEALSFASDAKNEDGTSNYYKDVINNQSAYMWWTAHNASNSNAGSSALGVTFGSDALPQTSSFVTGADGSAASDAQKITGSNLYKNSEDVDISLYLGADASQTVATHLINNISEVRKDCLVCLSPEQADVVNNSSYDGSEADAVVAFRNTLPSTSYATMDSGWKYQYDKYNDVYRYIPANGDTAGLMVRTDNTRDPWYSPAGFNRGQMKNVIRLAWNPRKAERNTLYKAGVNPVTTFPGQGTVLFGDKTLLSQPSAFDRINVRRLFITLEKAISIAAQGQLFEFNDEFTRAQFVNLVEPFLRDVQGRRGITDFRVVCDETNNTGEVIDRNEFVGDIFIKPARSINFIQLNFVAVRTGVEFSEVVGAV